MQPPQFPCGPFKPESQFSQLVKERLIEDIAKAPARLSTTLDKISDGQLDTLYKNWTARQIVHHIADSHVHSYIRFKWALTEECPMIKAYDEGAWSELDDARLGDIQPSIQLLQGLHSKWAQLLYSMSDEQFLRSFDHPQSGETTTLWTALNYYSWHSQHHTSQIQWLIEHRLEP